MNISSVGLTLIAKWEGFVPVPANDPAGNCTVGYGDMLHLGPCTPEELARPPITPEQGYAALLLKAQPYADAVNAAVKVPLNQNQFDALTSFCYNVGPYGSYFKLVIAAVNTGGNVRAAMSQCIKGSDGKIYQGLVNRRIEEADLYDTPEVDVSPTEVDAAIAAANKQVYEYIGNVLVTLGKQGSAIQTIGNALINHVATHPGGGATNTMAAALEDTIAKVNQLEADDVAFQKQIDALKAPPAVPHA